MVVRNVTIVEVVKSFRAVRFLRFIRFVPAIRVVVGMTVKMANNITPSDHMSC